MFCIWMERYQRRAIFSNTQTKCRKNDNNTYFDAKIKICYSYCSEEWHFNDLSERTKNVLNRASLLLIDNELIIKGEGGNIPFIIYFQSLYLKDDTIYTGIF